METRNTVTINNRTLPVKEFNGVRVVTFKDIDELHQRPDGTASRNFRQNREYFIEGEDYYKITPDEFRRAIGDMDKRQQNDVILITESGYLMITKSFKDELAWQIHRELVNIYFRAKTAQTTLQNLSPQLQAMINLEVRQNNLESRMNDLERRITTETVPEPEPKKKPQGKPWSEREKDYLRKAYALGQTDVEIAAELGRTVDSIHNKRLVLGLVSKTCPHWTKEEDKKLKRLLNKGLTAPEIGALIGRSAGGVLSRKGKLRQKGVKI